MSDDQVGTVRRGIAARTVAVAVSALVLLVVVALGLGPGAALAVAGLIAVVAGFVALVAGGAGVAAVRGRRGAVAVLAIGGAGAFLGGTAFGAPLAGSPDPGTAAVSTPPSTPASTPDPTSAAADDPPTALDALDALPVRRAATMAGYERRAFGTAWQDVDGNGCDTRNDVLARDLSDRVLMRCAVLAGTLDDPYTGRTIPFTRGASTSGAVRIDRVVSLGNAWRTGAQALPAARRVALANDPLNLFAGDGPAVRAKGDGDAAAWLPDRAAFRCEYVAHQVAVKQAYGLWVTAPEGAAMRRVLATCPDQALPGPALAPSAVTADVAERPAAVDRGATKPRPARTPARHG